MSNMLPQATVNAFRVFTNVSIEAYGMPCLLYVPTNLTTVLPGDAYVKPNDYTFTEYDTKVWVEWTPNKKQLSKLGIFVEEGDQPMIAHFSNVFRSNHQNYNDLDITIGSYFKLDLQYVTQFKEYTNEFDIVDVKAVGMANKLIQKVFKIAPRRVKNA